jgi:predicted amidohydrolase YtcJ
MSRYAQTAISTKKIFVSSMRNRYVNAMLWRGAGAEPMSEAFDVEDGYVVATDLTIEPNHVIDLKHSFVMPAFRDGHCHPLFAGREHLGPDVTLARSLGEIQGIIAAYAESSPEIEWIDGAAYDRSIDAKFHRSELDQVVSSRPVVLHGADHHTLWVNTRALELCGLMDSIPALSVGSVDLDANGSPTGVLREWEAMQLVLQKIPALSMEQELECLAWAQEYLFKSGVVEVQDAWIDPGMAEIYLEAAKRDRLFLKTDLAFRADPKTWRKDFEYFDETRAQIRQAASEYLTADTMKFFVDGVLGSSTASLVEPYVQGPAQGAHGEQVWGATEILAAATEATQRGYQLHLHAIGDLAVRTALDIFEAVKPTIPGVIAHTELISDQDVRRFAELKVTANFEPLWAREDGQLLSCIPQVGRNRIDKMYRMRDLLNSGARISFGSDWPVSSPVPLEGVATAVNRSLPGGVVWSAEQALSVKEALSAYSRGSALQISAGRDSGLLVEGAPAEFIVLSANPFTLDDSELFDLSVIATSSESRPLLNLN